MHMKLLDTSAALPKLLKSLDVLKVIETHQNCSLTNITLNGTFDSLQLTATNGPKSKHLLSSYSVKFFYVNPLKSPKSIPDILSLNLMHHFFSFMYI